MMELAYFFFISLNSSVKIDVAEMYCFFKTPVPYYLVHKKYLQVHGDFQKTTVCFSGFLHFQLIF